MGKLDAVIRHYCLLLGHSSVFLLVITGFRAYDVHIGHLRGPPLGLRVVHPVHLGTRIWKRRRLLVRMRVRVRI